MNFSIRRAQKTDVELIQKFGAQTFIDSFGSKNTAENMELYLKKSFSSKRIEEELNDTNTEFLLAFLDHEIVGYCKIILNKSHPLLDEHEAMEIERIYADKKYIGKNVGKVLLNKCFDRAVENELKVVWLGVWEHNDRAYAFYQKWGFEKFGEHVFMLGTDPQTDWLMKKRVVL